MNAPSRRCLIYNPDFPVLGGGERYTVALGSVIAETHDVTYAAPQPPNPDLARTLGFPDLDVIRLSDDGFPHASAQYDLAVVFTLQPPPRSFARRSIAVVQFPRDPLGSSAGALRRYACVVYSAFVRSWLQQRWGAPSTVLFPPVDVATTTPVAKENVVLAVGRFVSHVADQWNSKRQDVLIDAFARLPSHLRSRWRLVLAGGASPSREMDDHLEALRRRAEGLNIDIEINVDAERLRVLRDRARLFWHATGFGRAEDEPERAEHFGISTVEAMSHGAIPLVYGDGGQAEIVTPDVGRTWHSIEELVAQSTELMDAPPDEIARLARAAQDASALYSVDRFAAKARALLRSIGALDARDGVTGRARLVFDRARRRAAGSRWQRRMMRARSG